MALAALERERHFQRKVVPERESSWPIESYGLPHPWDTFLDSLNPSLPRLSAADIGDPILDISVLKPGMLDVYRLAVDSKLREKVQEQAYAKGRQRVVFQRDPGGIVEVGQNSYRNPLNGRDYSARPQWGTANEANNVLENINELDSSGYEPTHTDHIHPPSSIPFPSIPDLFLFVMHQNQDRNKPFINAQTILGLDSSGSPGVQVTAVRTAESHPLMRDRDISRERERWLRQYNAVGRKDKDQVVVNLAEILAVKFFLSTDMQAGHPIPPGELVELLRQKPQSEIRDLFVETELLAISPAA